MESRLLARAGFEPLAVDGDSLDYLELAYRRGLLVPFIGSGLSAPACPTWRQLIERIAGDCGEIVTLGEEPSDQQLIACSEHLVSTLRGRGIPLGEVVRRALREPSPPTEATRQLASVWWPLVLSTNYDGMFLSAFNRHHVGERRYNDFESMRVLGRSRAHCHTLLPALARPERPILWALQGLADSMDEVDLSGEIVLGYEQYREATFDNPGFRAAFLEVFRTRTLLFLGAGLSEEYFRSLFGESISRLGAAQHSHLALVNERELERIDPWFLHTKLNVVVLTYSDESGGPFSGFAPAVARIATRLRGLAGRGEKLFVSRTGTVTVEITTEPLPKPAARADHAPDQPTTHVVVGSGGFHKRGNELLVSRDIERSPDEFLETCHASVRSVRDGSLMLGVARDVESADTSGRARDLVIVAQTTNAVLHVAAMRGAVEVAMMLLSASGGRRWPRVFSLIQMLRGIRAFSNERGDAPPMRVTIHDTRAAAMPCLWMAIHSGRLDPMEILGCRAIRCFVEVDQGYTVTRTPLYVDDAKPISDVASYFRLSPPNWRARVTPRPFSRDAMVDAASTSSLAECGVVPGSSIRFSPAPSAPTRSA